ncbi:MutS-related protein [Clostridium formicaceticum]|uniref:DNA mismatch repair protein n=1 Tax=Clostridium formicaceticum TaxID=1497 RepID=A0AAC9WI04_9CLOT|nr:MutS family DNA mismatch repair protein [Clostridium formicaceticum]AOY77688.1 DNA mismatch repair protein [Clostridium formicaceticum]ARE88275.1 DNA mismatch repair protein MutS [Clostridium formicaceticum]
MEKARNIYEKRVAYYSKTLSKLAKSINALGNLRLLAGIIGVINGIFFMASRNNLIALIIFFISIAVFIYLVKIYNNLQRREDYITLLKTINGDAIKRLDGEWTDFKDDGAEFKNSHHRFSEDLDIFGEGSLFQWVSRCTTTMGKTALAKMLSEPANKKDVINKRQRAIEELSKKRWYRQRLQAEGLLIDNRFMNKDRFIQWTTNANESFSNAWVIAGIRILPIITISLLVMAYLINIGPKPVAILAVTLQGLLLLIDMKKRSKTLDLVYTYKNMIKVYGRMLNCIEKRRFDAEYLKELQQSLTNKEGLTAGQQLKSLEKLTDRILNRNNLAFFPINILTLWDYQCMIGLEAWKKQSGRFMEKWLDTIGTMEALSSLANISYDYPQWTVPEILDSPSVFQGKAVGHPLIAKGQVCNDINIQEPSRILLITGSNMSGKSTLLRTVGINLVLAYAGAPVCASSMKCSIVSLYTCMRISDNLEKKISSFYGELLRIKEIVEAAQNSGQVFFLIDEVFKGTNSHDRHLGAKFLIKQLDKDEAVGLVSTHDLELADIEKESKGSVKNYHFQEYYRNNEIRFDYKLRRGVSTTRNALHLIKMAGIEIEDES